MTDMDEKTVKVVCLHNLGSNSKKMRRSMQPYIEALEHRRGHMRFEWFFPDAPYMLPGSHNGGLGAAASSAKDDPSVSPASMHMDPINVALTLVSLRRALDAEAFNEVERPTKLARKTKKQSDEALVPLQDRIGHDEEAIRRAESILDSEAPDEHQARWWQIPSDAKAFPGPWIGNEHSIACLGAYIDQHGPFDGVIGHSGGSLLAHYCHSLLAGTLDRKQERLFDVKRKEARRPFRFSLTFAPYYPSNAMHAGYLAMSAQSRLMPLILSGKRDKITPPRELHQFRSLHVADPRSKVVCQAFASLVGAQAVWTHEGGHSIPRDRELVERIADWLERQAIEAPEVPSRRSQQLVAHL